MNDYSYLSDHMDLSGADYWTYSIREETDGITVEHYVNPDNTNEGITGVDIPWLKLASALWMMSEGYYIQYDGTPVKLREYHAQAARDLLRGKAYADAVSAWNAVGRID